MSTHNIGFYEEISKIIFFKITCIIKYMYAHYSVSVLGVLGGFFSIACSRFNVRVQLSNRLFFHPSICMSAIH